MQKFLRLDKVGMLVAFAMLAATIAILPHFANAAPQDVSVTIDKFVDGQMAGASSTNSASFPMSATWMAANLSGGATSSGSFSIGPTGFNSANPYEAVTAQMTSGANYSANEQTSTSSSATVGADCSTGAPFALVGYTTGDTLAQATSSSATTTAPSFTNMTGNKFIIVWNRSCTPKLTITDVVNNTHGGIATSSDFTILLDGATTTAGLQTTVATGTHMITETGPAGYTTSFSGDCAANGSITLATGDMKSCLITNNDVATTSTSTLKVHLLKFLDGSQATASSSNSMLFPMTATWQSANLDGGATTSGAFVLGNSHGGASALYGADTAAMQSPASYSASEVTDGSPVLAVGSSCQTGKFVLQGYKSSSVSFADAASQAMSTSAPAFTGLSSDRFVLVYNISCGQVNPPPPPPPISTACDSGQAPAGFTLRTDNSGNNTVSIGANTMYVARGGNNTINASGGNVIICLRGGGNMITLGDGGFAVDARGGNNHLQAGTGDGTINFRGGNNGIMIGGGSHTISIAGGNNSVTTGSGSNSCTFKGGNNSISGCNP